ncbi:MAG: STAS domain-containing protein [Comamonadaceae bacterium]|nr:STAS domain-containing protein [Comamonadaceae bacterium]
MLVLPPELTHRQASACLRLLLQGLQALQGPRLVVDAGPLAVFDSAALAVLLECRREALTRGKDFAVKGLPAGLASMAGLYGVDGLLPAVD